MGILCSRQKPPDYPEQDDSDSEGWEDTMIESSEYKGLVAAKTIGEKERNTIKSAIATENKIYAAAGARIYYAENKQWQLMHSAGALVFHQSLDSGILHFSLLDLATGTVAWSQEVYVNFEYFREGDSFHSFEGDCGIYGILFASSKESEEFFEAVTEQLRKTVGTGQQASKAGKKAKSIFRAFLFKRKASSSEASDVNGADTEALNKSDVPNVKKEEKKKAGNGLTHDDVSEPRDFKHLSHIGFNPEKGTFDIENIPSEWQQVFSKAGITSAQLESRGTAEFIAGFVDSAQKQGLQPPKMPPRKKKAAPIPPSVSAAKSPTKQTKSMPPVPPKKSSSLVPPSVLPKATHNAASTVSSAAVAAVAPPPPPSLASAPPAIKHESPNDRTALLASIRNSGGTASLKPVKEDTGRTSTSVGHSASDPHSALLASIRQAGPLKPVQANSSSASIASSKSGSVAGSPVESSDPSDMMAAMLAKALAARNRRLGDSDEDENDSDNDRW